MDAGQVYFGTEAGVLHAVSDLTGEKSWEFQSGAPIYSAVVWYLSKNKWATEQILNSIRHGETRHKRWQKHRSKQTRNTTSLDELSALQSSVNDRNGGCMRSFFGCFVACCIFDLRYYNMIYFGSDKMYRLKSSGRLEWGLRDCPWITSEIILWSKFARPCKVAAWLFQLWFTRQTRTLDSH